MEDKIKTPVFQVGDQVTYKNRADCSHRNGKKGEYYQGGDDLGGHIGTVQQILEYQDLKQCFCIQVTSKKHFPYEMLESEFVEYDDIIKRNSKQEVSPLNYKIIKETEYGLLVEDLTLTPTCKKCIYGNKVCHTKPYKQICIAHPLYYFIESTKEFEENKEVVVSDISTTLTKFDHFFKIKHRVTNLFQQMLDNYGILNDYLDSFDEEYVKKHYVLSKEKFFLDEEFNSWIVPIKEDDDFFPVEFLDDWIELLESNKFDGNDCILEVDNQYNKFVVKESIAETTTNPCNEVSLPTTINDWERKFYERFQCNHQVIKDFIQFLGPDACSKFVKFYDVNFSNLTSIEYFKATPPEYWLVNAFDWEDFDYWDILDSEWHNFLDNEYSIDVTLCLPGNSFLPLPSEQLQSCTLEIKEIPQPIQQQKPNNKLQFKF